MMGHMDTRNPTTPLLTWRGILIALGLSVVLCWPMWVFSGYFVFADTASYFRGGGAIWRTLFDLIPSTGTQVAADPAGTAPNSASGGLKVDAGGQSTVGRSFTYSALAYSAYSVVGFWFLPMMQAFTALIFVFALIDAAILTRPAVLITGFAMVAAVSTLPWYSVYLMPDIFAALVILYAGLLLGRYDDLTGRQKVFFTLLAALCVTFHYGYPPLMAGLAAFVLLWRLIERRLSLGFVAAAVVPLLFAPLLNITASSAVLGNASAAPQRLPILLARSLEDGPAYWYLKESCPEAGLALCEIFGDELPSNVGAFLWSDDGIAALTADQMDQIRAEEFKVLVNAFRAYPVAQTRSLLGNAAKQAVMIGTGNISAATDFGQRFRPQLQERGEPAREALRIFDPIVVWGTWLLSAPLLLLAATGQLSRQHTKVLAVVIVGLLLNAGIFGGLSAPVERYQSRVIWLLPLLSALFVSAWSAKLQFARKGSKSATSA